MSHWEDEDKDSNKARAAEIKARREKNPDHYKKASPSHQKQLDKYYKEYLGKQFESRGHKILDTWFKNRQAQQNAQIPTPAERKAQLEKQQNKKIKIDETPDMSAGAPETINQPEKKNKLKAMVDLTKKGKDKKVVGYDDVKDQAICAKEAVDKEHPIYKEYQSLKKHDIKTLRGMIKQQHRIIDTSEFRTKEHAISHILNNKHGNKRVAAAFGESVTIHDTTAFHKALDAEQEKNNKINPFNRRGGSVKTPSIDLRVLRSITSKGNKIENDPYLEKHAKRIANTHKIDHSINEQQKAKPYTMASKKPVRHSETVNDAKDTNHRQLNNLVHGREGGVHASERTFRKEETEMLSGHPIGSVVICKKTQRVGTVQGIEGDQYTVVYGNGSTETGPADYWTCSCGEALNPEQKKKQLRDALDRHTEKALAANRAGDDEAVRVHQQYMNKIKNQMAKMSRNESVEAVFDSTENQLDEISKATLGSYIKKANFDYGTARRNFTPHDKDDPDRKIMMKRKEGIHKAVDKLTKEEVEQIDELSKKTLASYAKRAASQSIGYSAALGTMKSTDDATQAQRKLRNRYQGTQKAINKLAEEDVELGEAWNVNNRNPQRGIQVGHKVRSYDFPGMHDDHYIEGHVVGETPSSYHIKVNKVVRHNKEIPIPAHMGHVEAPKGKSLWTDAYAVHKIMGKQEAVSAPVEAPKGGTKTFSKNFGSRVRKGQKV